MDGGRPDVQRAGDADLERARAVAAAVVDPEIPVLTLEDLGVLRGVDQPTYEAGMNEQLRQIIAKKGKGDVAKLLRTGDTWEVR